MQLFTHIYQLKLIPPTGYELINDLVSNHSIDMLDLAYPKHGGKQDAGAVAEMMLLRQSANSLSEACSFLVDRLTDAIGDENEVK